jgi:hypothetical protein
MFDRGFRTALSMNPKTRPFGVVDIVLLLSEVFSNQVMASVMDGSLL